MCFLAAFLFISAVFSPIMAQNTQSAPAAKPVRSESKTEREEKLERDEKSEREKRDELSKKLERRREKLNSIPATNLNGSSRPAKNQEAAPASAPGSAPASTDTKAKEKKQ